MRKIQWEPVAIVGIGCRFPGAETPQAFWEGLRRGQEAISEVPANRWQIEELYSPDPLEPGKIACKWGGFIENIDQFDRRMFHMLPREARYMDPQHRLLLEVTWEALEDAGVPLTTIRGSQTSVTIGIDESDYLRLQARNWSQLNGYTALGTPPAFAANRLSHCFGLTGPSISLDTACASSLTAIHLACQSLWSGEATLALAGGVRLHLSPDSWIIASKTGLLSRTGQCRALDASADGFVLGEGAGVLVLKPFSLLQPSDRVYALIRGAAVNHNGPNEWITAASQEAQENLLREAYQKAGVDPAEVDYVELHGTGFLNGDAIEARALGSVVGRQTSRHDPCLIGSVKTNIGHLGAAAGVAGLIKVALSLYHQELPPTLNLQTVNPAISLAELQLAPQKELTRWPLKAGRKPLAGVTALALSGTNAHVVLEGHHVAMPGVYEQSRLRLLPLSAASKPALLAQMKAFKHMLTTTGDSWQNICYTAGARRDHHPYRLVVAASTVHEAAALLDAQLSGQAHALCDKQLPGTLLSQEREPGAQKPVFVCAEGGINWAQLDLVFLRRNSLYSRFIDQCRLALAGCRDLLHENEIDITIENRFDPTDPKNSVGQFALQVMLAEYLRAVGILPISLLGEGLGLVTAAYIAGLVGLEEALKLIVSAQLERGEAVALISGAGKTALFPVYSAESGCIVDGTDLRVERSFAPRVSDTAMQQLSAAGYNLFVELGPQVLLAQSLPTLGQEQSETTALLTLGRLYTLGCTINWLTLAAEGSQCVSLPTYPWQRERLWLDWLPVEAISTPPENDHQQTRVSSRRKKEEPSLVHALETTSAEQWSTLLLDYLKTEIGAALEVDPVTVQDAHSFVAQGVDSLTATQLINRIQKSLGFLLPLTTFFHYSTAQRLAEYLAQEMLSRKQQKQISLTALSPRELEDLTETEMAILLTNKLTLIEEI